MSSSPEYNRQYRLDHREEIESNRRERRRTVAAVTPKKVKSPAELEAKKAERKVKKAAVDKAYRAKHADELMAKKRTPEKRFNAALSDAKRRGLEFKLSFDYWRIEVEKTCFYCRDFLGKRSETSVGLDRLDNDKGYLDGNVVSCCAFCNLTRGDRMSSEEMLIVANALINARKNK